MLVWLRRAGDLRGVFWSLTNQLQKHEGFVPFNGRVEVQGCLGVGGGCVTVPQVAEY